MLSITIPTVHCTAYSLTVTYSTLRRHGVCFATTSK